MLPWEKQLFWLRNSAYILFKLVRVISKILGPGSHKTPKNDWFWAPKIHGFWQVLATFPGGSTAEPRSMDVDPRGPQRNTLAG